MYTILICDDDRDIRNALEIYLSAEGYTIKQAANGAEAVELIEQGGIDLVLMDIMMPVTDGISATAAIRKKSNIPVIMLSAKSEDSDKVLGLNIGADDYITKPFNPLEVTARVKSALRRYHQLGAAKAEDESLRLGGIELSDREKKVTVDGEAVSLTPTEYEILKLLMSRPGTVFSPQSIYRTVWDEAPFNSDNTVAVHIRHLREKIEINPAEPRYITVVWGQGYKMNGENKK